MLTGIFHFILNIITYIIGFIIQLIMLAFPNMDLHNLVSAFTEFYNLVGKSMQLTYFLLGGMAYIYADIIIALWTIKHIALPIANFMRKIIIK